jgi:hypothetical protein
VKFCILQVIVEDTVTQRFDAAGKVAHLDTASVFNGHHLLDKRLSILCERT